MAPYFQESRRAFLTCLLAIAVILCGCSGTPEQRYANFFKAGTADLVKNDYARAILQFKNAIRVQPRSAEAYYELAVAYIGSRDINNAAKCLWKALELNPKYTAAELKIAELAVSTGYPADIREAEKQTRRLLTSSPTNTEALDVLAEADWRLGKQEEAEKLLNQAFLQSPHDLKSPVALAQISLSRKDVAGAEAILKKAMIANPNQADMTLILGRFYAARGRGQEAESLLERALRLKPKNGAAMISLAALRWQAGKIADAERLYKEAAALPGPQYQAVHAIFLLRIGKQDKGIAELERIYERDLSDREARSRLFMAYAAANRASDAQRITAVALKKNPNDVNALLDQSALYLHNGKAAQAQAVLFTALHFEPDSAPVHYLLATADRALGKPEMCRQELGTALRLDPELLAARVQLAELLTFNKGAKEARALLKDASPAQQSNPTLLVHLNWAALALGDWTEAKNGIDQLLAVNREPEVLIQDAILKLRAGDYGVARHVLQEALQKSPENTEALSLIVQSYEAEKQFPIAVQWLREYARQNPKSAPVQFELGKVLERSGDTRGARTALILAKSADPTLNAATLYLAHVDIQDDRFDEARKVLSDLISRDPTNMPAHLLMGNLEEKVRNYQTAIAQYRKAVELEEGNVEALNDLAYLLAEHGQRSEEALKLAQKAAELAPDNAAIADTLGWVLYRNGLYTSAIPYLERAADEKNTGLRTFHLALAYIKSGHLNRGQSILASALQMDPSLAHSELLQQIPSMQELFRQGSTGQK